MPPTSKPEVVYVGDPLCSWCWGFAPALRAAREGLGQKFRFSILMGGLRTGASALPLDDELRSYLGSAWREVAKRSEQPFDFSFLERDGFVYDTEPACRAVVTTRRLSDDAGALDYNEALQDAFYRRALDPTRLPTFLDVGRELGFDEELFRETYEDEATLRKTRLDFEQARSLGVQAFPTTLVRSGNDVTVVSRGWLAPEALLQALSSWSG